MYSLQGYIMVWIKLHNMTDVKQQKCHMI